ncbi:hypothetical protein KJ669_00090 [Patescibacteria group bacterium]|nr:hypothetical protein [Patescibacteria group bacterium]MBU2194522.1 hypothetical protein [Patescibacteria group bacterium]
MDEDQKIEEDILTLMSGLPEPVQEFLRGDERSAIVRNLSQKHSLHVDQAGEFEKALLFMLLGTYSPDQFIQALGKAGLTDDVVNALVSDVNSQIFMRLRDAEQKPAPKPEAKPAPLPPPAIEYTPKRAPESVLPGTSEPVPAPQPPPAVEPTPMAPAATQILHEAPPVTHPAGWHPAAAVHVYIPSAHPAAHQPVPESVPVAPTQPVRTQEPIPQPIKKVLPPAPTPIEKTYSADPYREPVE